MHYFIKTLFTSFFLFFLLVLVLTKVDFSSLFTANAEIATSSATVNQETTATGSAKNTIPKTEPEVSASTNSKDSILAIDPDEKPTREEEMTTKLDANGRFFAERLIVKFKDGVTNDVKRKIARDNKAKFIREDLDLLGAKVLKVDASLTDSVYESLKNDPNVEYVEKEGVVKLTSIPSDCYPDDLAYCNGNQWGLDAIYAPGGWKFNTGSSSVVVAVVDSGVDYNHYDLSDKVIKGRNFFSGSPIQDYDPMDTNGHGTFIAGTIAAETNNGANVAGVNWNAQILAIKAVTGGFLSPPDILIAGINDAANNYPNLNVKVINVSSTTSEPSQTMEAAVNNALSKGIIVVAGTAHTGDASTDCFIGFPAAYLGVISVAGVDENGQHAAGCTQTQLNGTTYQSVQMSAPGRNLYGLQIGGGSGFYTPPNTSFAAPFVSGVASILASCSSSPTLDLFLGANDLGPVGYDGTNGYGEVNLYKSLLFNCALPNSLKGDVDCNGVVDVADAMHILGYVAGVEPGGNNCKADNVFLPQGDVNGDFVVDQIDTLYILQILAGVRNPQTLAFIAPAVDTDGDGMTDQVEAAYSCLNPNVADANADFDHDGLTNIREIVLGTNPCVGDTDGDGYSDYIESYVGTKPTVKCGQDAWPPDINNDGRAALADVLSFIPFFNQPVGNDLAKRRRDLNGDGMVALADVLTFIPVFNKSCTTTTGTIQGYKVVMPNNQAIVPASSQTVTLDGGSNITNNPYGTGFGWGPVSPGNHAVSVTVPSGWTVGYTLCYSTQANCGAPNDPSGYHSVTPTPVNPATVNVNVLAGGSADLWWHYYPTPPSAPVISMQSQVCLSGIPKTLFSWPAVSGATSYEIYRWNMPTAGIWNLLSTINAPTTFYILNLVSGNGYTIRMRASNSSGDSGWSNQLNFAAISC